MCSNNGTLLERKERLEEKEVRGYWLIAREATVSDAEEA
jgi:hypothetical protein